MQKIEQVGRKQILKFINYLIILILFFFIFLNKKVFIFLKKNKKLENNNISIFFNILYIKINGKQMNLKTLNNIDNINLILFRMVTIFLKNLFKKFKSLFVRSNLLEKLSNFT